MKRVQAKRWRCMLTRQQRLASRRTWCSISQGRRCLGRQGNVASVAKANVAYLELSCALERVLRQGAEVRSRET
jgi:hypothetical protein